MLFLNHKAKSGLDVWRSMAVVTLGLVVLRVEFESRVFIEN